MSSQERTFAPWTWPNRREIATRLVPKWLRTSSIVSNGPAQRPSATSFVAVSHKTWSCSDRRMVRRKELRCSSSACRISACDHPRGASSTTGHSSGPSKGPTIGAPVHNEAAPYAAVLVDT